jgi:hypothetical protein
MRVKGSDALRNDNPQDDHLHFIDGVFDIKQMRAELQRLIQKVGGVNFVIVDTSAAYFLGQDENSNPQMGEHARMLRSLTALPGNPCVLVLCHPIKHATEQHQLLPRGGGAFLAEIDGNFTCWENKTTGLVEFHWTGKLRGPGFEPILFKIDTFTTKDLVDGKGRPLPTVRALHVSENEEEARTQAAAQDDSQLLVAMLNEPGASVAQLCRRLNWMGKNGNPQKSRLHRVLLRLRDAKPKLVQKDRDQWELTGAGRKAAKRFDAAQFEHQRGEN